MMLVQVLDRLLILASLYFLYMLLFHLPPRCPAPSPSSSPTLPDPLFTYLSTRPASSVDGTLCPRDSDVDNLMREFLDIQIKNLDTIKTGGKFIVYSATDSAGFGNRIPGLMSSFILALIMKRGFLVHWPEVSQKNITDVFDESSMVMSAFGDLFFPPVPIDIMAIPSFYTFIDEATAVPIKLDDSANLLLCTDLETKYQDVPFMVIRGYRPFFDLLSHNAPLLAHAQDSQVMRMIAAQGMPRTVHALAACLLRPAPRVLELVRDFREDNFVTNKHQLVGIHIRKFARQGLTKEEQEGLWSCVRKKYPPPGMWKYEEWGEMVRDEKEEIEQDKRLRFENATYLYFLASDSEKTIELVPPDFLPYVVRLSGGISRNTTNGIIRALADIWILGHSVEIFGAQGTTFLSAVRTLFPSKTNLAAVGGKKVDKYCRAVPELPCFKWWDIFESKNVPEFNLSCYSANSTAKQIVIC